MIWLLDCNTRPAYVPLTHFEMVMWFRIEPNKKDRGPVVRRPISANPGLDFNLFFFSFLLKAFCRIIFSVLFKVSNHQIVAKRIQLNMLFKLSYLKSYFILTRGYLNPALNNPARKDNYVILFQRLSFFFIGLKFSWSKALSELL